MSKNHCQKVQKTAQNTQKNGIKNNVKMREDAQDKIEISGI